MKNVKIGILAALAAAGMQAAPASVKLGSVKPAAGDVVFMGGASASFQSVAVTVATTGTGSFNAGAVVRGAGKGSGAMYPGSLSESGQCNKVAGQINVRNGDFPLGSGDLDDLERTVANDWGFQGAKQFDAADIVAADGFSEQARVNLFVDTYDTKPESWGLLMSTQEAATTNTDEWVRNGVAITNKEWDYIVYASSGTKSSNQIGRIDAKDWSVDFSNSTKLEFWNMGLRVQAGVGYFVTDPLSLYVVGTWHHTLKQKDKKNTSTIAMALKDSTDKTDFKSVDGTADLSVTGLPLMFLGYANKEAMKGITLEADVTETFGGRLGVNYSPADNFVVGGFLAMKRMNYQISYKGGSTAYPYPHESYSDSLLKSNNEYKLFIEAKDADAQSFSKYDWTWGGGIEVSYSWGLWAIVAGGEWTKLSKVDPTVTNNSNSSNTKAATSSVKKFSSPVAVPTTMASLKIPQTFHAKVPSSYETSMSTSVDGQMFGLFVGVVISL